MQPKSHKPQCYKNYFLIIKHLKYWLGWVLTTGLLIELTGVEVGPDCFIAFVDFWPSADFYNSPKMTVIT